MYAMVEIGGQSHKAEKGSEFLVNLIEGGESEKGKELSFENVTLISDNGSVEIGTPYLSASVKVEIVEPLVKGKKLFLHVLHTLILEVVHMVFFFCILRTASGDDVQHS